MSAFPLYIGGQPAAAASGETFVSYEPATGKGFADIAKGSAVDARRAVTAARVAFDQGPWPRLRGPERATCLRAVAAKLADHADRLAELETRDSGGTIRKTRHADIPAAVAAFEWAAHWAEQLSGTVPSQPPANGEYLCYAPYGVVAAIVPWNFPLTLAAWRVAPAIAAGNTCVLKPASFTSVTAVELARLVADCDIPAGVVNVVTGPGASTGDSLVRDPDVDLAAFTGSDQLGADVAVSAARTGKAVRLGLGGKSANVVLADADLDLAASGIAWSVFFHNGQICMAGARAVVQRSVYSDLIALLRERAGRLLLGDPLAGRTDLGPLVSRQQVRTVHRYVQAGLEQGARLACGGAGPEPDELGEGLDHRAYYRPTVLADVPVTSTVAREEIFGPVLAVIPADSDEHAISIANDTSYGLAGAVWSADPERARRVAERVRAERVWINDYRMVDLARPGDEPSADPAWPWLTNGLNEYRAPRIVRQTPPGTRCGRPHFDLLRPGI
jgi:acyl-CoA reductase-like NAD-dependent aldehyde dehydrogenase